MRAIEILKAEHRVIEQVLNCLEKMADRCESEGRIEPGPARDAVTFLRTFADRCHHGKEEEQLFPVLERGGFSPQQGPTAVMRIEHDEGRELVGKIDRSIDGAGFGRTDDCGQFVQAARAFVALLRLHIEKEDHCLFPMAEQSLGLEQQQALLKSFEQVEHEQIGAEVHEKCLRIAHALADRYGVPRAAVEPATLGAGRPTATETES